MSSSASGSRRRSPSERPPPTAPARLPSWTPWPHDASQPRGSIARAWGDVAPVSKAKSTAGPAVWAMGLRSMEEAVVEKVRRERSPRRHGGREMKKQELSRSRSPIARRPSGDRWRPPPARPRAAAPTVQPSKSPWVKDEPEPRESIAHAWDANVTKSEAAMTGGPAPWPNRAKTEDPDGWSGALVGSWTDDITEEQQSFDTWSLKGVRSTAFAAFLWGDRPDLVLQALHSGFNLRKNTTARMILFCDDKCMQTALANLVTLVWEVRRFEIQEIPQLKQMERLGSEVWSKLAVHKFLDRQFEVVAVIDLDMMAKNNMDHVFYIEPPAANVRGPRDLAPGGWIRDPQTFYLRGKRGQSQHLVGGINGGLWTCKPRAEEWEMMVQYFPRYRMPNTHGAEQDFITHWYAGNVKGRPIWKNISRAYNYQVHQAFQQFELVDDQNTWHTLGFRHHCRNLAIGCNINFLRALGCHS